MPPKYRTFDEDVRAHVNDFIISKYTAKMPVRLIDTYTGILLDQREIVSLLKLRSEFTTKLNTAIHAAKESGTIFDPESSTQRSKLKDLETFIAEYLAFAMFSHRWRGREPTLDDVEKAILGVYSMTIPPPPPEYSDFIPGVQKLQEFCCMAAKCGFRWAWSDTCCINKQEYADTSLSINSMFVWYRNSDLTIVYLDDVDDVKVGRFKAMDGHDWFEDSEIKDPFPSPNPPASQTAADANGTTSETKRYRSLYERLQDEKNPLQSKRVDTQVEGPCLRSHLTENFPTIKAAEVKGQYWKLPEWVTRGWTLQEMTASKVLRFYSRSWTLLEEAKDAPREQQEKAISISSFKYRARLVDHRRNPMWEKALYDTTDVRGDDLYDFKAGTSDIRSRLLWAARRRLTIEEDKAYCLLGIFDVSLPVMYGEGHRAFFRLQDELVKRTGDASIFDWCGHSSSVNTFIASGPECFIEPITVPRPLPDDSSGSTLRMIANIFRAICGTPLSGVVAIATEAKDWITSVTTSLPPGHAIVNGELNITLFEYQVRHCTLLQNPKPGSNYCHYSVEADGLFPATVTLASRSSNLVNYPDQYYLCRPWSRQAHNVFNIFRELIEYVLTDVAKEAWTKIKSVITPDEPEPEPEFGDEDESDAKLRDQMRKKRAEVMMFFKSDFPVYLVQVRDEHRVRVNTVKRVEATYLKFDFSRSVETRFIM